MKTYSNLTISQRRALVEAHPDYLYRSVSGYTFQAPIPDATCKTLAVAFDRCFRPFSVSVRGSQFVVARAACALGQNRAISAFDTAAAAAEYMSENHQYAYAERAF